MKSSYEVRERMEFLFILISAKVVNTVLALKSYGEWKQGGGYGVWNFGGNVKPTTTMSATKSFVRKNSGPFTNSLSRTSSLNDKSFNSSNIEWNKTNSSRTSLIRALLSDKRPEEIPMFVESLLSKLVDEVENRFPSLELVCRFNNLVSFVASHFVSLLFCKQTKTLDSLSSD
ncbi:kinesin-like protein KIN-14I [Benincasa hispida]|uniref:kinesin-like protein KIN-14I n=1 Tax=Benincasa hispida TaxID=102211 RepID=UPI0019010C58|nr:kinesin-like protein KIN-14I [Benincasa hispida]